MIEKDNGKADLSSPPILILADTFDEFFEIRKELIRLLHVRFGNCRFITSPGQLTGLENFILVEGNEWSSRMTENKAKIIETLQTRLGRGEALLLKQLSAADIFATGDNHGK